MMEESAKRTFERTGILMRKPGGMTAAGLQKKATGRALFAKLMYLADQDALLPGATLRAIARRLARSYRSRSVSSSGVGWDMGEGIFY